MTLSSALARRCSALLSAKLWSRRSRVNANPLSGHGHVEELWVGREDFFAALSEVLPPLLKADGFVGRPWRYRRRNDPFWHCLDVQRGSSGTHCYFNIGATPSFFSDWEILDVGHFANLTVPRCAFDDRLRSDWPYGVTPADSLRHAHELAEAYASEGRAWFSRYHELPGVFAEDLPEHFSQPRACFVRALIFSHSGDVERALAFAERCTDDTFFAEASKVLVERLRSRLGAKSAV